MQALQVVGGSTVSETLPPPPPLALLLPPPPLPLPLPPLPPHEAKARALLAQLTIAFVIDVQLLVLRHQPYTPVATQDAHVVYALALLTCARAAAARSAAEKSSIIPGGPNGL